MYCVASEVRPWRSSSCVYAMFPNTPFDIQSFFFKFVLHNIPTNTAGRRTSYKASQCFPKENLGAQSVVVAWEPPIPHLPTYLHYRCEAPSTRRSHHIPHIGRKPFHVLHILSYCYTSTVRCSILLSELDIYHAIHLVLYSHTVPPPPSPTNNDYSTLITNMIIE